MPFAQLKVINFFHDFLWLILMVININKILKSIATQHAALSRHVPIKDGSFPVNFQLTNSEKKSEQLVE